MSQDKTPDSASPPPVKPKSSSTSVILIVVVVALVLMCVPAVVAVLLFAGGIFVYWASESEPVPMRQEMAPMVAPAERMAPPAGLDNVPPLPDEASPAGPSEPGDAR